MAYVLNLLRTVTSYAMVVESSFLQSKDPVRHLLQPRGRLRTIYMAYAGACVTFITF